MMEIDKEAEEARDRLLDVLLAEELTGQRVARQPAAVLAPVARPAPRLLVAAAVLLGLGVVAAMAWLQRGSGPPGDEEYWALPRQDPQVPGLVVIRDPDHFRELLQQATAITLVRQEIVGAGRVDDENGSADRLDLVAWPETVRHTKGQDRAFTRWRDALAASLGERQRQNGVEDILHLELELPNNRRARSFVNVDGDSAWFSIDDGGAFVPTAELEKLLVDASKGLERWHRIARGVVDSLADLDVLVARSPRVEFTVPAEIDPGDLRRFDRLTALRSACLRGAAPEVFLRPFDRSSVLEELELVGAELNAERVAVLRTLKSLRVLTLRSCTGLDRAALTELRVLTGLEVLRCIDTAMGEDGSALAGLASLPALREFGLRARGLEFGAEHIESLLRTKLRRILLVDVQVSGHNLAALANLPSLAELRLVLPIDDHDLDSLTTLRALRRLMIRNAQVSPAGAQAFRDALPDCELDWRPDARFFDTAYAFQRR